MMKLIDDDDDYDKEILRQQPVKLRQGTLYQHHKILRSDHLYFSFIPSIFPNRDTEAAACQSAAGNQI